MDIQIKYTKKTLLDPAQMQRLVQPLQICQAYAYACRDRVQQRGVTATPAKQFSGKPDAGPDKRPAYYLSPTYAVDAGLGNQTRWESSQAMHAAVGAKPGVGDVTGKLWDSLTVRNSGDRAIVEFGKSSKGASSTLSALRTKVSGSYLVTMSDNGKLRAKQVTELKRDEGGTVQYRRKPKMVANSVKAGTVFQNSRVGLLQPTDAETQAISQAFRDVAGYLAALCFSGDAPPVRAVGDANLYADIIRRLQK